MSPRNKRILKNDEELHDVFMEFYKRISIAFRKEAKNISLTIPQLETLRFVVEKKISTMNEIANHLGVTAPSATVMIEHLYKKKLIDRRLDAADRRTVRIISTNNASKIFSSFNRLKSKVFKTIFAGLEHEDRQKLITILKKLI